LEINEPAFSLNGDTSKYNNEKISSARKVSGPSDIAQTIEEGPVQPKLRNYPKSVTGEGKSKRTRSFKSSWFEQYEWIEYSRLENSVYCFPCRFFALNNPDSIFTSSGYKNWKNAMSSKGFPRHNSSIDHKNCCQTWLDYKANKEKNISVLSLISADHARLVNENRRYMKSIILSVRMLAIQGSAFRDHRENEQSLNRGNFIEIMNLIASFDDTVHKKINGPKNARYLHHSIQTEIIHIMANIILSKISYEINCVSCFSIVIMYYYQDEIKERFLGFTPLKKLDANSLFVHIKHLLCDCKIDMNKCVAQTYDGANVMRGHISGVQALFRKEVPYSYYIHCNNHRLNLVLVDVAKNVEEAVPQLDIMK